MCTLSYIPTGENDFILTSNRDEHPSRSPQKITHETGNGNELLFPRDTGAGGSWIVASANNQFACVLNGAFKAHQHRPPYRRSRGLMVLDLFSYANAKTFFSAYPLTGIEPFTLIVLEGGQLFEFRWDEKIRHLKILNPKDCHLWSSTTLYGPGMRKKRQKWFLDWLADRDEFSLEAVMDLHVNGGEGDPHNGYVMNREGIVQTVSITNIVKSGQVIEMNYHDLIRSKVKHKKIVSKKALFQSSQ